MTSNDKQQEYPDPEVRPKAKPRRHSAEFKRRILREYEAQEPGKKGAFLRKEGLYSSNITNWRRQRERGELDGLKPKKRGRKANPQAAENARLKAENAKLRDRLEQAELIIEVQKKVSRIFGLGEEQDHKDESG
jgi:transposase-like protein